MNIKFIATHKPIGNFVNLRFSGNKVYISGQNLFDDSKKLLTGKRLRRCPHSGSSFIIKTDYKGVKIPYTNINF